MSQGCSGGVRQIIVTTMPQAGYIRMLENSADRKTCRKVLGRSPCCPCPKRTKEPSLCCRWGRACNTLYNALRMNSHAAHSDESLSCDVSETSTAETDAFDDILSRYTCTCDPELCLKLRRRLV